MSEKDKIEAIKQFMLRVDLKGAEVPAYNQCMIYIERLSEENSGGNTGTQEIDEQ